MLDSIGHIQSRGILNRKITLKKKVNKGSENSLDPLEGHESRPITGNYSRPKFGVLKGVKSGLVKNGSLDTSRAFPEKTTRSVNFARFQGNTFAS
jgi:hypothetical protein